MYDWFENIINYSILVLTNYYLLGSYFALLVSLEEDEGFEEVYMKYIQLLDSFFFNLMENHFWIELW